MRPSPFSESWKACAEPWNDVVTVEGGEGQVRALGEDEYFLLGDAPDLSTDARHFGTVSARDILARAWLVYWPPRRLRRVGGPSAS